MKLIQEFQLTETLNETLTTLDQLLAEDMSWSVEKPLEQQLASASFRFDAARRALSIANRLTDPTSRAKHRSRIMSMLNMLRASLFRLQDAIAGEIEAMQQKP